MLEVMASSKRTGNPTDEAALLRLMQKGSHIDVPTALASLAENPSPAVAAAAFDRLTNPDFTTQFPNGRAHQRKWLSQLNALGKQHPEIAAVLAEKKRAAKASDDALGSAKKGDVLDRIAQLRAVWASGLKGNAAMKWQRALNDLHVELFGKWSPYPARAWRDLSPAQWRASSSSTTRSPTERTTP